VALSGSNVPPASNVTTTVTVAQAIAQMGDWLTVTVENPPAALVNAITGKKKPTLYLEDFPLKGLSSEASINTNTARFQFHLEWTDASSTNWVALLSKPHLGAVALAVSVGLEDGSFPALAADGKLTFYALPTWQVWLWGLFLLGFLVWFVWLWGWSELLRDSGPDPGKGQLKSFSLARTQMAIWFFLTVTAFVFLRVITGGATVTITNTVLVLMGIATGTALGAEVQDSNKVAKLQREKAKLQSQPGRTADENRRLQELTRQFADRGSLEAEKKNLETLAPAQPRLKQIDDLIQEKARLQGQATRTPDEASRLQELTGLLADGGSLQKEHATLRVVPAPAADVPTRLAEVNNLLDQSLPMRISHGFFEDILTDDVGISFHRFQMFIWTIVLAIFFIGDVLTNLAMPEFGNTLLALMGISSGTYLGFMINEPHSSEVTKN